MLVGGSSWHLEKSQVVEPQIPEVDIGELAGAEVSPEALEREEHDLAELSCLIARRTDPPRVGSHRDEPLGPACRGKPRGRLWRGRTANAEASRSR